MYLENVPTYIPLLSRTAYNNQGFNWLHLYDFNQVFGEMHN